MKDLIVSLSVLNWYDINYIYDWNYIDELFV